MNKYEIHPAYRNKQFPHTLEVSPGKFEVINLTGTITVKRKGTATLAPYEDEMRGATQEELAELYKQQEAGKLIFRAEAGIKLIREVKATTPVKNDK